MSEAVEKALKARADFLADYRAAFVERFGIEPDKWEDKYARVGPLYIWWKEGDGYWQASKVFPRRFVSLGDWVHRVETLADIGAVLEGLRDKDGAI